MLIAKQEILSLMADRGATDKLAEAENDLPDPVDTDLHVALLTDLGMEPHTFGTTTRFGEDVGVEDEGGHGGITGSR